MSARSEIIHGISATRASAIIGLNKWKTPLLAWQEIQEKLKPPQFDAKGVMTYPGFNAERGFILPPREDKAVFRWGHAFESAVIELSEQQVGSVKIVDQERIVKDDGTPQAFGYVDGVYGYNDSMPLTIHEGKTTFERAFNKSWGEPGTDRVPDHVQVQVQHCMMCADADETIVSVLVFPFSVDDLDYEGGGDWEIMNDGDDYWIESYPQGATTESTIIHPIEWARPLAQQGYFHQYPVKANRDTQKLLRECYDHFWHKYVIPEIEPEITDYDDIRRCFPSPKGQLIVPEKIQSMLSEYSDITKELGTGGFLAKRKVELKTDILKFCMDKTTVADDDAQEKIVFLDDCGGILGSFNGKSFRC